MRFLVPVGGNVGGAYGVLTSPQHKGIPLGIINGMPWAADLGCIDGPEYVKRYRDAETIMWLDSMTEYKATCLFVTVPDVVGDASRTIDEYHLRRLFSGWPCAYVAQDGCEALELPMTFDTLFVGGSTEWKLGEGAAEVIRLAQQMGKHIHIGRVNWWRRYAHFRLMPGSEEFTCDGTRTRFDGAKRTLAAWDSYVAQPPLLSI